MKKKFLRLLALCLILAALLSAVSSAANPDDYTIPDDWSHDALVFAVENDILRGNEDGDLLPDKNITRAEMAAVLVRLLGAVEEGDLSAFTDIPEDAWYKRELAIAYGAGIFSGISATKMNPNAPITREQAVVVLCRAFGLVTADRIAYTVFSDSSKISDYARDSASAMKALDILGGYPDGSFRPAAYISRAEVAQLLYKTIDVIVDTPDQLPESGRVLYRGTEALPDELTLDGTLILGPTAPSTFVPENWQLTGDLVIRTGKDTSTTLEGVTANAYVCAPQSGSISADKNTVYLWGSGAEYLGDVSELVVMGGAHTYTGTSNKLDVRGGSLIHTGSTGDITLCNNGVLTLNGNGGNVKMDIGTTLTVNGNVGDIQMATNANLVLNGNAGNITVHGNHAKLTVNGTVTSITVNGTYATISGTGRAGTITINLEGTVNTLACDTLNDVWYETYQKYYDNALNTVKTMRVPCPAERTSGLYTNRNLTGWICEIPKGTVVYNEWHPAGDVFYVSLSDGRKGWVPRWDFYIPDDVVTTDGTLDYSEPVKEGFVDLRGYDSKTDYMVWVSRYTQKVIVYKGSKGNWDVIKTFPCSSGENNTPTPEGIFEIYARTWTWYFDYYYVNKVSIFNGGHAFHTILMDYNGGIYDDRVGIPLSHGCIRMLPDDCQYIYDLPEGTRVVIY